MPSVWWIYPLSLPLEVSLRRFDRIRKMAVDHPDSEARPRGVVAGSDSVDEGFFCGKTGCCVVPSQGLARAGKIKNCIEVVRLLL